MASSKSVETEVELLKREVNDMKQIHHRLDSAIEKIADVSSSLHTIMAVHEEKLIRQEENLEQQEKEIRDLIVIRYGIDTFREMIQMRKTIKANREKAVYAQRRRQRQVLDGFVITIGLMVCGGIIYGFYNLFMTFAK